MVGSTVNITLPGTGTTVGVVIAATTDGDGCEYYKVDTPGHDVHRNERRELWVNKSEICTQVG